MSAGNAFDMADVGYQACRSVLLRAAEDWSDFLVGFETGPRAVTHRAALEMAVGMVRRFTCPLFTDDTVAQKMLELSLAVQTLDRLVLFGTWDDEDEEVFGARTADERLDKAQRDVDYQVYGLLTGVNPCTDCASRRDFEHYQPPLPGSLRCAEHDAERKAVLASRVDHKPLHSGQVSEREFHLLHGGEQ